MSESLDSINFSPKQDDVKKKSGPISIAFDWTVGSGRKILVITSAIVIAIFLLRIKLDQNIIKLTEKVEKQEAIILSMSKTEKDHRVSQEKLDKLNSIQSSQIDWASRFESFTLRLPKDVTIEKITYTTNTIEFSANAKTSNSFGKLLSDLISDESINEIILTGSKYDPDIENYSFSLEISLYD